MGEVRNATEVDLTDVPHIGPLPAGATVEVDDDILRREPFQYPPFEVNGVQRVGEFLVGDDYLEKFHGTEPPVAQPETPPAASGEQE